MTPAQRFLDITLVALIIAGLVLAASAATFGGFSTSLAGIRISSRTVLRPFVVAVAAILLAGYLYPHREEQWTRMGTAVQRRAGAIAIGLVILSFVIVMQVAAFEANAADQYGYVSQAVLWARGQLIVAQPLAAVAPWPEPTWTFSPLGYRPGPEPATIVPTYPPGLPLLMAALLKVVGPSGVYVVVPLLGGLCIWVTFVLGRRLAGATCGLMAAALLLSSPIFLFQLKEPMSDVPVTAWWLVALALAMRQGSVAALAAGLAASAAIMTRPNLAPLAIVIAGFVLAEPGYPIGARVRRASLFSLCVLPGCLAVALINQALYGSPVASGYGSAGGLFGLEYLRLNLSQYSSWLLQSETPFVCLAAASPWLVPSARRMSLLFLAFSTVLLACYAFYLPFDNWTFLRFLLPAIPLLLILSSASALSLCQGLTSTSVRWLVIALFCVLIAWRWDTAVTLGFRPINANDRRFEMIGQFVRDQLPPNAVVLSMIHSGSVRHYSGRATLRWDWLPPEWLDPAISFLRTAGYPPYLLIEEWERAQFKERFSGRSALAALDWPPAASYRGSVPADIFDPADLARFKAGQRITTMTIGSAAPR